ncbi:kielin/chordin-like protein [Rhincodon typus]|uniref:kielin/chordin-like protein n=1 Tax=Rhincodon typus TaxID=259920 RepID=UPI00202FD1D0|nr:kielin/chordin-like protein [Rhincodon typus]
MCCRLVLCVMVRVSLLWGILVGMSMGHDISQPYYHQENVIDLLEALNITRSIKGVSRSKGLEPGFPAWKFRNRVPHLTLPRDYAIYFLTSMQGSIGFHFVAKQSRNSEGTVISFTSPTITKKDGQPLLQLVSSTRSNQLRLDYRTVHNMEPASVVFPGGTPFGNKQWGRVAFNLEAQKITLFIDCEEDIIFEKTMGDDAISLILPIDLEIHFSSTAGDHSSKFTGYWQTAEISPSGFTHRPWHCDNLPDSLPLPYSLVEERYSDSDEQFQLREEDSPRPLSLSDSSPYHQQQSDAGEPLLSHSLSPANPEQRLARFCFELHWYSGCPLGTLPVRCPDLCQDTKCPGFPNAECRVHRCGACFSEWYDQGSSRHVMCHGCSYKGQTFHNGDSFIVDTCTSCVCLNGAVSCAPVQCQALSCKDSVRRPGSCCPECPQGCADGRTHNESWKVDACTQCSCKNGNVHCQEVTCLQLTCLDQYKPAGECCAVCRPGCEYEGKQYMNGDIFSSTVNPCMNCSCVRSLVRCVPLQCQPLFCSHPVEIPGQCCPRCPGCELDGATLDHGQTFSSPDGCQTCVCTVSKVVFSKLCIVQGLEYEDGAEWELEESPCTTCTCVNGNVTCRPKQCPPVSCLHPGSNNGHCCPSCDQCTYNKRQYRNGQEFIDPDDPCQNCHCQSGTVRCAQTDCPPTTCTHPERKAGQCCAKCPDCVFEERILLDGQRFPNPVNPCQECTCLNGQVTCEKKDCISALCSYPLSGSCCHNNCNGCQFAGKEYPNGADFPHPTNKCKECHCINGNVQCLSRRCPPVSCSEPFRVRGKCCLQCPAPPSDCLYDSILYQHMQRFYDPSDACRSCICNNGTITCQRKPCAPVQCSHPILQDCCRTCDGCLFGGKEFANGEQFADVSDSCNVCVCREGSVSCERNPCPVLECPFPMQGRCCRVCDGCNYMGEEYLNGQEFPGPLDPCSRCECISGFVSCSRRPCYSPGCRHPINLPGQCCPVCEGCYYGGVTISNGQTFTNPTDTCSQCTCRSGSVHCVRALCAPAPCPHPISGPCDCPQCDVEADYIVGEAEVVTCWKRPCSKQCTHPVVSTACCPECNRCSFEGLEYENRETFFPPSNRCKRCSCLDGSVLCLDVVCPRVTCSEPVTNTKTCCPECPVCIHHGKQYNGGSHWISAVNPCHTCTCTDGDVLCLPVKCPTLSCRQQITKPGSCCPQCRGCMYNGKEYQEGATWSAPTVPCMTCMCVDGVATCSEIHCIAPCVNQIHVPRECCPLCVDCIYNNRVYSPGESFQPSSDPCEICTCEVMLDGEQHLHCYRRQCPSLVDCPRNLIVAPSSGHCCPSCAQPLSNCTAELFGSELLSSADPCYSCHCKDLTWICIHQSCPLLSCSISEQFTPDGSCCPICDECVIEAENRRVSDGETWTDSVDECITCSCNLGHIECHIEECLSVTCHDGLIKVRSPGQCCYECQDPRISCSYQGQKYQSNQHWEVDECTTCTCISGEVHCQTEHCPPVTCSSDESPVLIPGMCCPHCIPRPATCMVFGDPHYLTFDGKMIHFQGACSYVLAEDCKGGDFSIHVTNDDRGRTGVSWTKEVTVLIGDLIVQLLQDWLVTVDDRSVSLPFLKEPYIYIERRANSILLNTNIGVKVLWNGKSHLEVSLPGTYKGQVCGLCGNFNNYPQDDMRIRSGQIVTSEATFGNSWKVHSNNQSRPQCSDAEDIDPCKQAGYRARKEANAKCKILKSKVFEQCHAVVPPEMFFSSCVYDLCACGSNIDDCLCDALEAYASQCREASLVLNWRSPTLCAVGCPSDRGYVFDECGPPCPKTCFNKDVPLGVIDAHCFKPCVPGCQCPAGLVEHESHCIAPETCPKIIYGNL